MIEFSNLGKLAPAYKNVCSEIKNPAKNKKGVHNAPYADLDEVINVSKKVLAEHGFSLIQMPYSDEGKIGVETMLLHESGEWVKGCFATNSNLTDPQKVGGLITYYRRYSLVAMLNLVGENDDDADSISDHAQSVVNDGNPSAKQLGAMFYKVQEFKCGMNDFNFYIKPNIKLKTYKWLMDNFSKENFDKVVNKIKQEE